MLDHNGKLTAYEALPSCQAAEDYDGSPCPHSRVNRAPLQQTRLLGSFLRIQEWQAVAMSNTEFLLVQSFMLMQIKASRRREKIRGRMTAYICQVTIHAGLDFVIGSICRASERTDIGERGCS